MNSHARLKEAALSFFMLGLYVGSCLHRYPTIAVTGASVGAAGVCISWWRLKWLNERETKDRKAQQKEDHDQRSV